MGKKIAFLTLYPDMMSSRIRVNQFKPYLEKEGVEVEIFPAVTPEQFEKGYNAPQKRTRWKYHRWENKNRKEHFKKIKNADVVVVQKGITLINWKKWSDQILKIKGRLIYDIDDAVFYNSPAQAPSFFKSKEDKNFYNRIITHSWGVMAGSNALQNHVRPFNPNVLLLPSSINTDIFKPREFDTGHAKLVIGWLGTEANLIYLNAFGPAFQEVCRRHSFVEFHIICSSNKKLDRSVFGEIPHKFIKWKQEDEVEYFKKFDIGIMPLIDNEWTRFKCSYKLISYMAMGIPSVSSAVGNNIHVVQDGEDGFLAKNMEDWIEKLSLLCSESEVRREMGIKARKTIVQKYSTELNAKKMLYFMTK